MQQTTPDNPYQTSNPALFAELLETVQSGVNLNVLQKSKKHLDDWMREVISKKIFQKDFTSATLVYWILNGLQDYPKCANPSCQSTLHNVSSLKKGYRRFCCPRCANSSPEVLQLREQRSIQKHGVPHYTNREKAQQTTLLHFGVPYPFQAAEVQAKAKDSLREAYGVSSFMETPQFRQLSRDTLLAKFGVDNIMKVPEKVIKAADTKEARYGDRSFNNRPLQRKTMLETFGVESNFQLPEHRQMLHDRKDELSAKKRATLQKNYGIAHPPSFNCIYDGISFDSAPEVAFYIWLTDHGIPFTFQPDVTFEYFDGSVTRKYHPDFLADGQLVELKGDHFFQDKDPAKPMICPFDRTKDAAYEAKHQCMLKNGVKILTSRDYQKYLDYVTQKHGKHFLKSLRRTRES